MSTPCPVLLVEDDRDIRLTIADILQDEGYRVVAVASGTEALAALEAQTPCLILLDLMMPGMNGWEFQHRLVAMPAMADVPVVVLSGGREMAERIRMTKATAFLEKPINLDQLLDAVAQYCRPAVG